MGIGQKKWRLEEKIEKLPVANGGEGFEAEDKGGFFRRANRRTGGCDFQARWKMRGLSFGAGWGGADGRIKHETNFWRDKEILEGGRGI